MFRSAFLLSLILAIVAALVQAGQLLSNVCEQAGPGVYTILSRMTGDLDFNKNIQHYENGFFDGNGNCWAGLRNIHQKVQEVRSLNPSLRVNMTDWNDKTYSVVYEDVNILGPNDGYRLFVSGFRESDPQNPIGDMLQMNDQEDFWAVGREDGSGCVRGMQAGWWYSADCTKALPTGHYYKGGHYTKTGKKWDGIFWQGNKGYDYSFKTMRMDLKYDF